MRQSALKPLLFVSLLFVACSKDTLPGDNQGGEVVYEYPENALPLVAIYTQNVTIPDEPKIQAILKISDRGEPLFEGPVGIETRGQSSQYFYPKKQYGFETRSIEDFELDVDVSLLGLPEEEDWILQAPYGDKSLMRNVLTYSLSEDMGRYASRTRYVNLNLNDQNDGVYVLMERLKRDVNRIDINELRPVENEGSALTGGYILKIDKGTDINPTTAFASKYTSSEQSVIHFLYETPDAETITTAQKDYIQRYISDFEDALQSENFTDANEGYKAYINVDSFVDFFILTELGNNVDGYRLSTWLTKDRDEKLKMGPVWDFNLAYGNANYCAAERYDVWAYRLSDRCPGDFYPVPFWWMRLMQDPAFKEAVKTRFTSLRQGVLSDASIAAKIEQYRELLDSSNNAGYNFSRWPILGEWVWPNFFVGQTYNEEVDYLKEWTLNRTAWLDEQISQF
jgi:hypothetical protein